MPQRARLCSIDELITERKAQQSVRVLNRAWGRQRNEGALGHLLADLRGLPRMGLSAMETPCPRQNCAPSAPPGGRGPRSINQGCRRSHRPCLHRGWGASRQQAGRGRGMPALCHREGPRAGPARVTPRPCTWGGAAPAGRACSCAPAWMPGSRRALHIKGRGTAEHPGLSSGADGRGARQNPGCSAGTAAARGGAARHSLCTTRAQDGHAGGQPWLPECIDARLAERGAHAREP